MNENWKSYLQLPRRALIRGAPHTLVLDHLSLCHVSRPKHSTSSVLEGCHMSSFCDAMCQAHIVPHHSISRKGTPTWPRGTLRCCHIINLVYFSQNLRYVSSGLLKNELHKELLFTRTHTPIYVDIFILVYMWTLFVYHFYR